MPIPRSGSSHTSVSVVAWLFIAVGGYLVFSTATEAAMLYAVVTSQPGLHHAETSPMLSILGWNVEFTPRHHLAFALSWCVYSLGLLVMAIGLARRARWSRVPFICLLAAAIAYLLLHRTLAVWFFFFSGVQWIGTTTGAQIVLYALQVLGIATTVAIAAGLIWVIKHLTTPQVVAQFTRVGGLTTR